MKIVLFGFVILMASAGTAQMNKVDCNKVAILNSAHKKTRYRIEDYNAREEHRLITTTEERFNALKPLATAMNNQVERLSEILQTSSYDLKVDETKSVLQSGKITAENVRFLGGVIEDHSQNFTALITESKCTKEQLTMCLFEKVSRTKLTQGITPIVNIYSIKKLREAKSVILLPCASNGLIRNDGPR